MAGGGSLGKDMQQGLVRANHKSGPLNAKNLFPIHVLFLQNAKLIAYFLVYISKERVRQVVFGAELGLILGRIAGDAQHHGASRLDLLEGVAEAAGLNSAARSIRPGIKEEYDGLASVVGQAYGFILIGLQGEIGNFLVQFHGEVPRSFNWRAVGSHQVRLFPRWAASVIAQKNCFIWKAN